MDTRQLVEQYLAVTKVITAEGPSVAYPDLVRRTVLSELCPDAQTSGGYHWSATSNYLNACRRALALGKPRPQSRGQLSEEEKARVWLLCLEVARLWEDLQVELHLDTATQTIPLSALRLTDLGRRLWRSEAGPRLRPSALAAA